MFYARTSAEPQWNGNKIISAKHFITHDEVNSHGKQVWEEMKSKLAYDQRMVETQYPHELINVNRMFWTNN